jgi:hypothetical protein
VAEDIKAPIPRGRLMPGILSNRQKQEAANLRGESGA